MHPCVWSSPPPPRAVGIAFESTRPARAPLDPPALDRLRAMPELAGWCTPGTSLSPRALCGRRAMFSLKDAAASCPRHVRVHTSRSVCCHSELDVRTEQGPLGAQSCAWIAAGLNLCAARLVQPTLDRSFIRHLAQTALRSEIVEPCLWIQGRGGGGACRSSASDLKKGARLARQKRLQRAWLRRHAHSSPPAALAWADGIPGDFGFTRQTQARHEPRSHQTSQHAEAAAEPSCETTSSRMLRTSWASKKCESKCACSVKAPTCVNIAKHTEASVVLRPCRCRKTPDARRQAAPDAARRKHLEPCRIA
ncbi:hypothetical protein L1887_61870 [Cichorium endivia]|nr:hypothetical protein L1887_61870 [Cichorium endivia]